MSSAPPRGTYPLGLVALAALLAANAVAGPALTGTLDYPLPTSLLNQLRGLELVTVVLVVPALLLGAILAQRGRSAASLVALGPCGYASYMFVQYVVGPDRTTYSPAILLHLVVFALSNVMTACSWWMAVAHEWPAPSRLRQQRWVVLLLALAGFVMLRYLPLVAGTLEKGPVPDEYAAAPAFYWTIVLLDLGLVVPAVLAAALAVRRGSRLSTPATYGVVGWFALVPPSVSAMAWVMLVRDDPAASLPTTLLLSVTSLATSVVAVRMFAALLRRPEPARHAGAGPWREPTTRA